MFKIGNVEIKGKFVCAPMAGVTNKAFRKIIREMGASLVYTEMTSNVGLKYNAEKAFEHAGIGDNESPIALQIFGGEIEDYIEGAKTFDKNSNADIIDINMGCPVNKVAIKSNAGSSLVKTPNKIKEIIEGIVAVIDKPLTIKIRIGWDEEDLTYLEVAKIAEEAGAAAIAVHGRTRSQMYSGKANWNAIAEIKKAVSIPVIGNGDVDSPEAAVRMLEETGVDAVMIGREARDNPFIFRQINEFIETGSYSEPTLEETINLIHQLFEELEKIKPTHIALKEMKGLSVNFLTKFKSLKQEKNKLVRVATKEEFMEVLKTLFN